jgi:RNA polymerase sigma factor (sigma-70 family)
MSESEVDVAGAAELPVLPGEAEREAARATHVRRVVIEDDQRRKLDRVRARHGYDQDVSPHAHSEATFRLINERKELDMLPGADFIVPALDDWKFWTKMNDWDSRNQFLESLIRKVRRREASDPELQFLIVVCGPTWRAVARSLRRYGGLELDPRAQGRHAREEAARVNELDRHELDQVMQHALMDALQSCPRSFPRRFFPWLKATLAHRALDHVRAEICEHDTQLPHEQGIKEVLDALLRENVDPASPAFSQWLRTKDLDGLFTTAEEYAPYARVRSACEHAVDRLPRRQRRVIQQHYFEQMTQAEIAAASNVADSTIRNTHRGALRNLRRDDELFDVLEAVGRVRDRARRLELDDSGSELQAA